MRFSNPNKFEKMRRLEGMRESEDIWDTETFDDIKQRIEQFPPNTKELLFEEELTAEAKRCLEKTRIFCNELSEDFKQTFLALLEQYKQDRRQISQKILDYLLEKDFILPGFTIAGKEQTQTLLAEYEFYAEIDKKNLLLVFQLPKPLAQFWWKGGAESWGDRSLDIKDNAIEWGHFYRELMPVVWETQGRHENENGLDFFRLNAVGEHDPKKYYYMWEMSEWGD
ncbi:MAG TPA: hypothetical protein VKP03_02920 [Patescibacteria group bacterium]|nr:hypothetical protein [Patescibacteria group bacterium]